MGTIPAAFRPHAIVAASAKMPWVDPDRGLPSQHAQQFAQQVRSSLTGISRIIPCSSSGTNTIHLTLNSGGPLVTGYFDYDVFSFVADGTATGAISAYVTTAAYQNTLAQDLATLLVYKNNGGTAAGAGDTVAGRHYTLTFVDSLNSGSGGFVLR